MDEVFAYLKKANLNTADHLFKTDFDEFCTTFNYGLQAFSEMLNGQCEAEDYERWVQANGVQHVADS